MRATTVYASAQQYLDIDGFLKTQHFISSIYLKKKKKRRVSMVINVTLYITIVTDACVFVHHELLPLKLNFPVKTGKIHVHVTLFCLIDQSALQHYSFFSHG